MTKSDASAQHVVHKFDAGLVFDFHGLKPGAGLVDFSQNGRGIVGRGIIGLILLALQIGGQFSNGLDRLCSVHNQNEALADQRRDIDKILARIVQRFFEQVEGRSECVAAANENRISIRL